MVISKNLNLVLMVSVIFLLSIAIVEAAHTSFATEKSCYDVGSGVKFKLEPNAPDNVTVTDFRPWDIVTANNNHVYSPARQPTNWTLYAGDWLSWSWNQRNSNGLQVPTGPYKVVIPPTRFYPNHGVSLEAKFSVAVDKDEDCIADTVDKCPYDATNSCLAEQIAPESPIGGATCVPALDWCPNDRDGDGAVDENDKCPTQSGPEWNEYCPDHKYKQDAANAGSTAVAAAAGVTVVATLAGTPITGLFFLAGEVVFDAVVVYDATEKIRKDPPDKNYKEIAALVYRQAVLLPETSEENYILNKIIVAAVNYNAAANAFVKSNERFQGAELAGNKEWTQKQAVLAQFYARKTAQTLRELNEALTEYKTLLEDKNANVVVTKKHLQQFQENLRKDGLAALPQQEIEFAKNNLFATENEINFLKDSALSINSNEWNDEVISIKIDIMKKSNEGLAISLEKYAEDLNVIAKKKLWIQPAPQQTNSTILLLVVLIIAALAIILIKKRK